MASEVIDVPGLANPEARGEEAAWYERCGAGALSFQRCASCAGVVFPPRGACPMCGSLSLAWEDAPGTGTVYSCTVQRRATRPGMPEPSVIALVDADPGFRLLTRLVCEPGDARVGLAVQVRFAEVDGVRVPVFVPA